MYNLNPYVTPSGALSNVQPFTYPAGTSYAEMLERLSLWVQDELVPWLSDPNNAGGIPAELARLEVLIAELQASQDVQDADIAALEQLVQSIIDNSIQAQDEVVAGLLQDDESDTTSSLISAITDPTSDLYTSLQNVHAPTRLFLPAHAFGPIDGNRSPAELVNDTLGVGLTLAGGVNVWRMPTAVNTAIGTIAEIPPGWHTFDIRVYWAHTIETPTGQIFLLGTVGLLDEGTDITANDGANGIASTLMPARREVGLVDIPANTTLTGQGNAERIIIVRQGASAADTFPNDAGIIGVELVKTA